MSRSVAATGVAGVFLALLTPVGASAAPTDIVISEIMYDPISGLDGDEFVEIANPGAAAVDLSGWTFVGITLTLPAGTSIAAGGFLVVSPDAARFQATYGRAANAVYTGGLKNGGEPVTLKDANSATIDLVSYVDRDPWPGTPDGGGKSLELIDPTVDNNDYLDWAASTAASGSTPGTTNSVARAGLGPRITAVTPTPTSPAADQPVTVTATVTGQTSAPALRYKTDFAAEQTLTMEPTGTADVYAASIPGAAAGHLIRYRVEATNAAATTRYPRIDDVIVYKGVVVPSGVSSPIPLLEWFISDTDYNTIVGSPTADIERTGAIAYNGTVFDNVTFNIRGANSQSAPKQNWKVALPHNSAIDFGPTVGLTDFVDEFAMQADFSDKSHGRPLLSWDAYKRAGVVNAQLFPMRVQRNAAFQGLYTYVDLFDGTWRDRQGYSNKQFFKSNNGAFDASRPLVDVRFEKKNPDDGDFAPLRSLLDGIALTGNAQKNFMLANTDIPELINHAVVTSIVDHQDSSSKNFYLSQDPATGRWSMIPWDLDHTLGNGCCGINSTFVTPAEPGDKQNDMLAAVLAVPEWRAMYFRRLRTLVNDILAPGRMEALYDAKIGPAAPVATLDFAKWPYTGTSSYTSARTQLFNAITARRNVFATDARVPGNQSASPNIVINELQPSPTNSNGGQFVELYNPSATEAVDLSGWTIAGGISLTIQPGTVILPGGRMTFVSNDPTFRSTYGGAVFVGGRFTGALLSAGGTLSLARPDTSVADTVTFGGTSWPQPTDGRSLELRDPALDNNDGTSWDLSRAPSGTPGAANGDTTVTVPGAPTIGAATGGNAQATVTWTAPANNGGSAITGYQVRVVNNATNQQVGTLRPAAAAATSLVVTGLTNGTTTYRFQVAATNSAGDGPFSAASNTVTPSSGATVPGAPVIGAPTQGPSGGTLTALAHWTPPASTGGSAITGYQVTALRMSSSAVDATVLSTSQSPVLGAAARQRSFALASGNYRFTVVAINAAGTSMASARSANVVPR